MSIKEAFHKWNSISLVKRILCGLIIGIILGLVVPQATGISILGDLFVGALKGIAPILVFFLVMSALSNMAEGQRTNMKAIVVLYILGNLTAAMVAVFAHYLFPVTMTFASGTDVGDVAPPSGVTEVLTNLLMNLVDNPVNAIVNANYIGILFWAIIFGIALKKASEGTKNALENVSDATSIAVQWVISFAPFGIMGLIFTTISEQGLGALVGYAKLIVLLVGAMAVVALSSIQSSPSSASARIPIRLYLPASKKALSLLSSPAAQQRTFQLTWNSAKSSSLMKTPIPFLFRSVLLLTWPAQPSPFLQWLSLLPPLSASKFPSAQRSSCVCLQQPAQQVRLASLADPCF